MHVLKFWWDQDEGNDGLLDVNDIKMGGSFDDNTCGATLFWIYVGCLRESNVLI